MSKFSLIQRGEILSKTGSKCASCGADITLADMTIDHYIPSSKGGYTRDTNLYPLCKECNHNKGNDIFEPDKVYRNLPDNYIYFLDKEYTEWLQNTISKIKKNTAKILVLVENNIICTNFNCKKSIDLDNETLEFGRKINKCYFKEQGIFQGYERLFIKISKVKMDTPLIDETKQSVVMIVTKGNRYPNLTSMYELYRKIENKGNRKGIAL